MSAPPEILQLVDRFDRNLEAYRSGQYNETQLRREFLDPLFTALGWDVENKQGYAEAYKDVIHEDAIKVGGATKAPDYCFRIGGTRKFFVEAKKPSVNLKDEISPAYQLRRYAWSAKLSLSILTDFDEFAVYDCRVKPGSTDTAATARTLYVEFKEYPERWEEIASIFSRDAVLKGSFDRYAESTKAKKGTAEVDDAFLKEIEAWRDTLARTIALRNTELTQRELNFAVQRTIDRMIFLRICEDRGIETYGALMALQNGEHVYKRLCELFHRADEKYNSGLFHFRKEKDRLEEPDELTVGLSIDDKPLKEILRNLYYPDSPYEFSVLPADILGQVYEQFLGKVIRLTAGHRAVVEDKPEVKKAGGVYYTPTYIVDYIVKNTVGKLLGTVIARSEATKQSDVHRNEIASPDTKSWDRNDKNGNTPKQASELRILDPACGSGSFLIGVYQYLLDWHRDWYVKDGAKKWATGRSPVLYQVSGGDWRLTTAERKRILLNNIYGVDIDPQAVEVTKLSLLLKVLEGENEQTISRQLKMFHERALPDLGSNIKCGNSLIGPDFYQGRQLSLLDEEERLRINVFDWKKEFKEIMDAGGFDAVIGNPPYVRIQTSSRADLEYFTNRYEVAVGNFDIYCLFVEQGATLLRHNGLLGFIVAHRFYKTDYGEGLRQFISRRSLLRKTIDFDGFMVFENASINSCVLVLEKQSAEEFFLAKARFTNMRASEVARELRDLDELHAAAGFQSGYLKMSNFTSAPWVFIWPREETVWAKLTHTGATLGEVTTHIFQGIKTGADAYYIGERVGGRSDLALIKFEIEDAPVELEKGLLKPLIKGGEMQRYAVGNSPKRIIFPYFDGALLDESRLARDYPKAWAYFSRHKTFLSNREDGKMKGSHWYGYTRNQALTTMYLPKIITPDYYAHASYCLDSKGDFFFCGGGAGGYGIVVKRGLDPRFLLGLLNSKLLDWFLHKITLRAYQTAYMYVKKYIEQLPIRMINFSDPADKSRHDRMVEMVEQMLTLHKQLASAKTEHEKIALQRQIDATDKQIDQLVYELYGITEEEQKIIEETNVWYRIGRP